MNKQIKRFCVTGIIVMFVCYFFAQVSFASVWGNWRECASAPGCSCTLTFQVTQSTVSTLKTYIVESAGYFLKSHATYQDFLSLVEMTDLNGVDYKEMRAILYSTVDNMEKAKASYANLKAAAEKIPNDPFVIDKLLKFDYDSFQVKYGLIEPIFEKVKSLLSKGDIAGLDNVMLANMDIILNQLYEVKNLVDKEQSPDISLLWRINQTYAEAQLFGQYMSEVFRDILF